MSIYKNIDSYACHWNRVTGYGLASELFSLFVHALLEHRGSGQETENGDCRKRNIETSIIDQVSKA